MLLVVVGAREVMPVDVEGDPCLAATFSSALTPWHITSRPMPSPAMTAILAIFDHVPSSASPAASLDPDRLGPPGLIGEAYPGITL